MDARGVIQIAGQCFEAMKYGLRTHVIARVDEYDDETNTVKVTPVRKAIQISDAKNITTVELPQMTEIIVRQHGSGKLWCTVAPAVGSYGYLHISDRDIDGWKAAGGIAEPTDPRCHELRDAIFEPSLLHLAEEGDNGLMVEPIKTDRISLRTRSGLTEISVLEDESVTVNVNGGNATVTIDPDGNVNIESAGTITATADSDVTIESGGDITLDNGVQSVVVGSTVDAGAATDFVAMAQTTDQKIQAIADAITNAAVGTMDGGAAFKAAIIAALTPALTALGSVASTNLKAE